MESKGKWSRPDEEIIAFYVPQGAAVVKRSEVSHGSSGLNCKGSFPVQKSLSIYLIGLVSIGFKVKWEEVISI